MIDRLRFALLFARAVVVATIIAHALDGPRGYWLPMTVAFVFRPDLGPVMRRAISRVIGTLAGVGIAALVAIAGNQQVSLIILCCAMAAAVPWAAQRSHALTVMVFTPIIFRLVGVLGPDQSLFGPRIVDTAIGAAIVSRSTTCCGCTPRRYGPVSNLNRSARPSRTISGPLRPAIPSLVIRSVATPFARSPPRVAQSSSPVLNRIFSTNRAPRTLRN